MYNKVIYIFFGTMTKGLYEAICVDTFQELGIKVELVDLNELFFKRKVTQTYDNIKSISTYNELDEYIKSNANVQTIFNVQIHYETRFWKLFRILTKYNCKISIFEIGYQPYISTFSNKYLKYLQNPIALVKRVYDLVLDRILIKFKFINLIYDVRFTAGEVAFELASQQRSKEIIQINYVDYEYNKANKIKFQNKDYFIFLDINLINRHDEIFAVIKNSSGFDSNKYLENLNNFFDKVEEKFNVEVIIAAHPKSNYSQNEFANRKIIKDDTVSLVRSAQAVISHHSTSISYAVLNKKPLIFIYDESIKSNFENVYIFTKTFANYLQMPFLNIDLEGIEAILSIVESKYDEYKYDFLTTRNSEQFTNKQIIEGFIKNEMVF